ncbi:hypothetical protein Bca4012_012871 [Brassica carinata]
MFWAVIFDSSCCKWKGTQISNAELNFHYLLCTSDEALCRCISCEALGLCISGESPAPVSLVNLLTSVSLVNLSTTASPVKLSTMRNDDTSRGSYDRA